MIHSSSCCIPYQAVQELTGKQPTLPRRPAEGALLTAQTQLGDVRRRYHGKAETSSLGKENPPRRLAVNPWPADSKRWGQASPPWLLGEREHRARRFTLSSQGG